jgi:O-antigen ligase
MPGLSITSGIDQAKLSRLADGLVVAVAVSLPWSTSATAILVVVWLLALIPTLCWADVRRELLSPVGGLPVLLVAMGLAGMFWADVTLLERWKGFDSFLKLLVIPLLFAQYRRSDRGEWVFAGYLLSCVALVVATIIVAAIPAWSNALMRFDGVLVKSAATQSGEFVTCIFGLVYLLTDAIERRRWQLSLCFVAVILAMLATILFVATGRTALVIALVLLILYAIRNFRAKGIALISIGAFLIGIAGWTSSSYLRDRTIQVWTDLEKYEATDARTSSGERIEFWKKSIEFIRQSPVIGHGTGSIHSLFAQAAAGHTETAGVAAANPHNQTLAVGIQLGLVGATVLWAMWIAHLLLFGGRSLAAWIGLVVVVQNVIGSLFNSHLFDFVQGWVYVVGVGVAGGIALKSQAGSRPIRSGDRLRSGSEGDE